MPGHPLHVGAAVSCPHQGRATATTVQPRVQVGGRAVTTTADSYVIAGCTQPANNLPPCLSIRWTAPATRVRVMGAPLLTDGPGGICLASGAVPQGPTSFSAVQTRVIVQ